MKKFWTYEITSISALGFTLSDVSDVLQIIALIIAIASGIKAWKWSKGKDNVNK